MRPPFTTCKARLLPRTVAARRCRAEARKAATSVPLGSTAEHRLPRVRKLRCAASAVPLGGCVRLKTAVGAALLVSAQLAIEAQQAEPQGIAAAPPFDARALTAHSITSAPLCYDGRLARVGVH